jgi:hypothetical protein
MVYVMIYHRIGGERYILFIEYQLKASPDCKKGKGEEEVDPLIHLQVAYPCQQGFLTIAPAKG